jgi:hypothetical protein
MGIRSSPDGEDVIAPPIFYDRGRPGEETMDYSKMDAGMRAALQRYREVSDRMYPVFIHTSAPVSEENVLFLKRLGVDYARAGMKVFTATLPSPSISMVSDQEWVSAIRLSRRMKPI